MAGFGPNLVRRTRRGAAPSVVHGDGCDLEFSVDLVGVRSEVSAKLRTGEILLVGLRAHGVVHSAACTTQRGEVVGTLAAFVGLARLIGCLEGGAHYLAEVEVASATRCAVKVMRR